MIQKIGLGITAALASAAPSPAFAITLDPTSFQVEQFGPTPAGSVVVAGEKATFIVRFRNASVAA